MKPTFRTLIVIGVLGTLVLVSGACMLERPSSQAVETNSFLPNGSPASKCAEVVKVRDQITALVSDDDRAREAAAELLAVANRSAECRQQVIEQLMRAMDKPDLDFIADRQSFYLWRHGALILGKLRAVEALDLMIDHLDLNDGLFSASMYHQPAVAGVEVMGTVAIPKLGDALVHHKNKHIRLAAALCLVDIGGADAMDALKQALKSETEPCVRRFVQLAFERPTADVLRERLLAFRCNN